MFNSDQTKKVELKVRSSSLSVKRKGKSQENQENPRLFQQMKLETIEIANCLGWLVTNLENWECFYFPDVPQISTTIGNHSQCMKTSISTVWDIGNSLNLLVAL